MLTGLSPDKEKFTLYCRQGQEIKIKAYEARTIYISIKLVSSDRIQRSMPFVQSVENRYFTQNTDKN